MARTRTQDSQGTTLAERNFPLQRKKVWSEISKLCESLVDAEGIREGEWPTQGKNEAVGKLAWR